jgi:hypothetical protein
MWARMPHASPCTVSSAALWSGFSAFSLFSVSMLLCRPVQQMVTVYFKLLSKHLSGGTENHSLDYEWVRTVKELVMVCLQHYSSTCLKGLRKLKPNNKDLYQEFLQYIVVQFFLSCSASLEYYCMKANDKLIHLGHNTARIQSTT